MRQRLVCSLGVLIFLLYGCDLQVQPSSTLAEQSASPAATKTPIVSTASIMQQQWLEKKTCAPPCWEGIVPGTTIISDALRILQDNPRVRDVKFEQGSLSSAITWRWDDNDLGGIIIVNLVSNPANNVVDRTSLDFEIRFSDLVAAYGYPSAVSATSDTNPGSGTVGYSIQFTYEPQGFFFNAVIFDKNKMDDHMLLIGPSFFSPTTDPEDITIGGRQMLVPWQGMQTFDFYCRNKYTYDPCEP
jgi:hypothetical protein